MIRIIAESTCDLSPQQLALWGVESIPMKISLDGQDYYDGQDISSKEFFAMLEKSTGLPTTSQVNPVQYQAIMEDVKEKGEEALFVVFSSGLSGSYQSAQIAKDMVDYEGIRLVDTLAASAGQGLIVHQIAMQARAGASLEELEEMAFWLRDHTQHLVMVDSLEMLKRGGRVSGAAAFMGGVMNIKPLLHMVDGKLLPFAKAKGKKKAMQTLMDEMDKRSQDLLGQTIFLAHGDNLAGAQMYKEEMEKRFGITDVFITELGATIGSHTGKGVVTFFFLDTVPAWLIRMKKEA